MKELKNLINQFNSDNLNSLLRAKSRSFRRLDKSLSHLNDEQFRDCTLFGEFEVNEADLMVVFTAKVNKPLSERSRKKAQYTLGKKFLRDAQKYIGGFFIFYDYKGDFRFSLIYDIPLATGKRDWSNFRRHTYFVSKDQTNKTFIHQIEEADFSSLEKIIDAFSVEKVTKQFYQEIANWYFWAVKNVRFPKDAENETNGRNIAVIRLITRLIFIWFMKAKGLIGNHLFNPDNLKEYLINFDPSSEDSNFYKAILQNLFFATLNTKIEKRKFRWEETFQGKNKDYMKPNYYRYHSLFKNPNDMLDIFKNIPFLNGGLFECLDKSKDDPTNETGKEIRIDGFSDKAANQAVVPNYLFFSSEQKVDLQKDYDSEKYKDVRIKGLINILETYNFTIDENSPIDEEVALDPELLGKVFENLLAAYNPETATTVRKATGSYYTPREIVNYMVDESLIAYLKNKMIEGAKSYIEIGTDQTNMFGNKARKGQLKIEEEILPSRWIDKEDELEVELRKLISYAEEPHIFNDTETEILIDAINSCKILDPAVGSGAFPMGVLHKLVLILSKLDPHNIKWKQQQINAIKNNITDPGLKEILRKKIEDNFKRNELDYGRKLYLIQNCLYGVDIQPIAIQIAKLRFFISLLVDEKVISPEGEVDNLGIDPLPNLETKLVAANTLIGLPDTITLRPFELDNLEKELFELRQKYFTTSEEREKKKLENEDRELRKKIRKVLDDNRFDNEFSDKIASWDPYDTNKFSEWFDPEWMFGVKVNESSGFDIVIGNPPYISTKDLDDKTKRIFQEQYGFADDTYNHFFFKGMQLLKNNGLLTYISSKTFWTIETKKNLRNLLLDNKILILFDTANPFEAPMVDTCVAMIQKQKPLENHIVKVLDGKKNLISPINFSIEQKDYKKAPNKVLFIPNDFNKKIYERLGKKVNELLNQWWTRISTSKNIEKFKRDLEEYRKNLKPGDVTLLGLITEGGQGLATANNGKYIGVLENTKWTDNVLKQRPEKLLLADKFCKKEGIKTKKDAQVFLNKLKEKEIRELFDNLKEKYGRDIFGQGWLFRIVSKDEIADVNALTEDEKLNGIKGNRTFVPYDKGDKDGNRWYAPTPYYIDWSKENVRFLKENSGKKGEGMPVVRNPQFYFREGFCWTDVNSTYLKSRLKDNGVYDVLTMSLFTTSWIPDWYFVCLINSKFISEYVDDFINSTSHFQINDARQLPVIIPTSEQLNTFEKIFNNAYRIQKDKFDNKISYAEAESQLSEIQKELDALVEEMYMGIK